MQEVIRNYTTITEAIQICLQRNLHFASYRLPGEKNISMIIQKTPELHAVSGLDHHLPEKGFLIAPFSREKNETWLIRPDIVLKDNPDMADLDVLQSIKKSGDYPVMSFPSDTKKADYLRLIEKSIVNINAGSFEKVVLSRVKSVKGSFRPQVISIFQTLCTSYPDAFVYLFCVKGQCWIGASPEPFICSQQNELKTVSLAGTRPYHQKNLDLSTWNHKELEEQEFVTRHIEKILRNYNISSFSKKGP